MKRLIPFAAVATSFSALALVLTAQPAAACGCLSPPVPETVGEFAVNQQSEQIIFEAPGDGTVTAHVLIKYAGDPAQFAWLVPVPSLPELALSESTAFGLLDQATSPQINVRTNDLCPDPDYVCRQHPTPNCNPQPAPSDRQSADTAGGFGGGPNEGSADAGTTANPGGVMVLQSQQIGSYETVVFSAEEAMGTVTWLQTNGFIVNDTMTPYMQPYLDAGMLFIAAKLIPGADVSEIRPLKMTYVHPRPIIPLKLTAVAAEPHLTITSYFFGDTAYQPVDHPLATVDATRISRDNTGRTNYPMVLSRTIDEAGGDAFVTEYQGNIPQLLPQDFSGCCDSGGGDFCNLGGDGQCQCPRDDFDTLDCQEAAPGLIESLEILDDLTSRYGTLTRLTTRLSPEEMTFDPQFEPTTQPNIGRLSLSGTRHTLNRCKTDIIEPATYAAIEDKMACASVYCGAGECVVTAAGAGCRCDVGQVARTFNDLDGKPSVTCQPRQALVDLGADIEIPSACSGVSLTNGSCVDVGGFPSSDCNGSTAGVTGVLAGGAPACWDTLDVTASPGAEDFSAALAALDVCAPKPQSCGPAGWLVVNEDISIQGVSCPENTPSTMALTIPPKPACDGDNVVYGEAALAAIERQQRTAEEASGSCQAGGSGASWILVLFAGAALLLRRRRQVSAG